MRWHGPGAGPLQREDTLSVRGPWSTLGHRAAMLGDRAATPSPGRTRGALRLRREPTPEIVPRPAPRRVSTEKVLYGINANEYMIVLRRDVGGGGAQAAPRPGATTSPALQKTAHIFILAHTFLPTAAGRSGGDLLGEEVLEGRAVLGELLDALVQLVERHLVLEERPAELGLVVDE
jgi:hypothetical protein